MSARYVIREEAQTLAKAALAAGDLGDWRPVAAALQKLMDERDMKERVLQHWKLQAEHWRARAEAAEKDRDQFRASRDVAERAYKGTVERVEAAEKARQESAGNAARAIAARNVAEARLAECVREVREWLEHPESRDGLDGYETDLLAAILHKYSSATPPSPVQASEARLAECVRRAKAWAGRHEFQGLLTILEEYDE